MSKNDHSKDIKIDDHRIHAGHLDKEFFPGAELKKGNIVDYYQQMSEKILPFLKNRPLVLHRFPDGIGEDGFYQKQIADYFPDWMDDVEVTLKNKKKQQLVVIQNKADIVYLANQAALTFHPWLCEKKNINHPDRMVFDLDPPGKNKEDFKTVKFAAKKIQEAAEEEGGLNAFVMTTGSKGLHVVIPIKPEHEFDAVRDYARKILEKLTKRYPDELTLEMRIEKRKGRLFLDYTRNAFGQTTVAPYCLRPKTGAPVATPLSWEELSDLDSSQKYHLKNINRRIRQKTDPWQDFDRKRKSLTL
jgi:bifunctional non-homologous end joining protein LigD